MAPRWPSSSVRQAARCHSLLAVLTALQAAAADSPWRGSWLAQLTTARRTKMRPSPHPRIVRPALQPFTCSPAPRLACCWSWRACQPSCTRCASTGWSSTTSSSTGEAGCWRPAAATCRPARGTCPPYLILTDSHPTPHTRAKDVPEGCRPPTAATAALLCCASLLCFLLVRSSRCGLPCLGLLPARSDGYQFMPFSFEVIDKEPL